MSGFQKLRITNYELRIIKKIFFLFVIFCGSIYSLQAQSTNQSYPTAITSNEISGQIAARDVGDARLTSYFYFFNATQGDVFINVVTKNLNGDIDVFTADNLRPLTKITIYADASEGETGRVVYLRQPTKLILRVEGRTPNDDAATFRVKFAGSFVAAEAAAENAEASQPAVKSDNQTDVRVNAVGTILEIKPKSTPAPKETVAIESVKESNARREEKTSIGEVKSEANDSEKSATFEKKATSIENQKEETSAETATKETIEPKASAKKKGVRKKRAAQKETIAAAAPPKSAGKTPAVKPLPSSALENVRLVVLFKDGTKIERSMNEVLKVGVDRGILTVISKDGQIGRYSILDVEKMTIE